MEYPDSTTSLFPLNPLTAIGPLAEEMMRHNLDGEFPSPHGPNSCWAYCMNHDAVILHLGIDAVHYMTMLHVTEENSEWPIPDDEWYFKSTFKIIDGNQEFEKMIKERKYKWGMLRMAEKKNTRLLKEKGVVKEYAINGIKFSITRAQDIRNFYQEYRKKHPTFPYYK